LAKGRPEGVAEALSSLVKAALLDMDFAISVYLDTLDEQRRRAEEERAVIEREAAVASKRSPRDWRNWRPKT